MKLPVETHIEAVEDQKFAEGPNIEGNINHNINARIQNPLKGIPKDILLQNVNEFCAEYGFKGDDVKTFQKAAVLAQNPTDFEILEELTDEDKEIIRRETTHKWSQPKALYFTIFLCSLGAAIQGWDNTGANGANLSYPQEFGIENDTWLSGFINAAPSAMVGAGSSFLSDPLNNYTGRRGTLFITGLFCVFPVLCQAFCQDWLQLMICRLLLGLGMGPKITTIPIFSAETVPANIRGGLVMSFQLWVAFGIFIGFCSNLIFYRIGRLAWRVQLAAAFVPAVPLLLLIWLVPESPRWLMKKGRYNSAFRSFLKLRNSRLQAARDMYYAHCQIVTERDAFRGKNILHRFYDLFTVPRIRTATLASWIVMLAQQLCGINIMSFYSSEIFSTAGYNTRDSLLASFGFGLVNFTFAFPAIWTIDTFGRRNLLLFTFPNMAWSLLAAGFCFYIPTDNSARVPLIALFVYIFTAFYSPGQGPVPFTYSAECYPLTHREIGMSFSVEQNNLYSAILGLCFPTMLKKFGSTGAFGFYAGTNVIALIMIFFGLPETKQRTLEELDYIFAVPMTKFAAYQGKTWLPWFIKKYILFQRNARLEPLYTFDGIGGEGTTAEHYH